MADLTQARLSHLRWAGDALLPPAVRAALLDPGQPFELVTEPVLGHPATVFAQRPRALRPMLDATAAGLLDQTYLVSPQRSWTYREALEDIDALAVLLTDRYGIRAGDRIAIVAANHAEYALLMWATLTIGAIVTSLNGWWTTPELAYGIGLTQPSLVAGDERRLARLTGDAAPPDVPVLPLDELLEQAAAYRGQRPESASIAEDDPAVILFTSGTTGRPKGATLSHRNIINFASVNRLSAAIAALTAPPDAPPRPSQMRIILTSPMFHISGLVGTLITGGAFPATVVFPAPGAWDPLTWLQLTQEHRITALSGVPTQFWRLLRHPQFDDFDLSSVVNVGGGGAVFPPELVRELHERFPSVRLGNGYGMSETVGMGTITGGDLFVAVPEAVGPAQPTIELQIRHEDGTVLPEGEIGEIHLRGPAVFLGYWDDQAATGAALDADRWYRTGDYGRVDEGLLHLESRRSDLILRGGENVYPIEIENRLVDHPDIEDAAVIGVPSSEYGQLPKAFVVLREGAILSAQQVREWCGAALAAYKVPDTVEFRPDLPYSETGKVLKRELEP